MQAYLDLKVIPVIQLRRRGYGRLEALGLAAEMWFAALQYAPGDGDLRGQLGDAYEAVMADWLRASPENTRRMLDDCEAAGVLVDGRVSGW